MSMDDLDLALLDRVGLRRRFSELSIRAGVDDALFETLDECYSQPTRFYHNWRHICECLGEFDRIVMRLQQPLAVELAIWFHDAVYEVDSSCNEWESAAMAFDAIPTTQQGLAIKVRDYVRETDYSRSATVSEPDLDYLKDIDFSAFGKPFPAFWHDVQQLRRENALQGNNAQEAAKRITFYQAILEDRVTLFRTDEFRDRYLVRAFDNLRRGIVLLRNEIHV